MKLKLHSYWRSGASWRVRIALAWKGLGYEYVPVNIVKGAEQLSDGYRAVNPMAQVPTLEISDDGDDRVERLTQSLAIIDYLEQRVPTPRLYPAEPRLRAQALMLAEVVNSGIQPLQNIPVLAAVGELGGDKSAWARKFITHGFAALEAMAAPHAGLYLVGDEVSVADICLIPQLTAARRFDVDLSALPTLVAVEARLAELEPFKKAHPDQQPDAVR